MRYYILHNFPFLSQLYLFIISNKNNNNQYFSDGLTPDSLTPEFISHCPPPLIQTNLLVLQENDDSISNDNHDDDNADDDVDDNYHYPPSLIRNNSFVLQDSIESISNDDDDNNLSILNESIP